MARIDYYGTDELIQKLDRLGGNVDEVLASALLKSAEKPKEEMLAYIKEHKRTGLTESTFTENIEHERDSGTIYLEVGFDIKKGGLPALFLNYGTPTIEPSFFINNAIDNNIEEIKRAQIETIEKAIKESGL